MKEKYKCTCCECWSDKKGIDHISHSTGEKGYLCQYILCKACKKEGCLGLCKRFEELEA